MSLYSYGEEIEYEIVERSSLTPKMIEDFSCGNEVIDYDLKENIEETSKYVVDINNQNLIGFISYQASGVPMVYESNRITKPALLINLFAIDKKYQHLQFEENQDYKFTFSDEIFCKFLAMFRDISDEYLYFEYIILYSVPLAQNYKQVTTENNYHLS
ncbi:MAG: hypothetical protein IJ192_07945 [Clostridia bacterium]|nr:hypothetical protein [Clostridia bacterium]